jgi:hypothetical protein
MGRGSGAGAARAELSRSPNSMRDIDFLPVQYRQKHVERRSQAWRVVVVAAFALLLAAAALSQHGRKRRAEAELAAMTPQYDVTVSQDRGLTETYDQLLAARSAAELFTYLRHPWPRTQLLAALVAPLPQEITLRELRITREVPQDAAESQRRLNSESAGQKKQQDKLPPAVADLRRLRDECDANRTTIAISAVTSESAAAHRYLGALAREGLFAHVELDSLEIARDGHDGTFEFRATVVVRPGYGQPGGPGGPAGEGASTLAQTNQRSR